MNQQKQAPAMNMRTGVEMSQKVQGHVVRLVLHVGWFLVTLGFTLVFGFIGDRPRRVATLVAQAERGEQVDRDKKILARLAVWLSAVFHVCVSLILLTGSISAVTLPFYLTVLIGFVHLPLAVSVAARRRSANDGVPYTVKALTGHVAEVLESMGQRVEILAQPLLNGLAKRRREAASTPEQLGAAGSAEARNAKILRHVVLGAPMVLTALLSILAIFKLSVSGYIFWTGGITWAMWMYIAWAAAGKNIAIETDIAEIRSETITVLRQIFGGPAADWEGAVVHMEGDDLVATNVPLFVALRQEDADATLAQIAPEWELGDCTPGRAVLQPVSDDTRARRAESVRSGGLIGGRIDSPANAEETAATATVTIAAEDLFS